MSYKKFTFHILTAILVVVAVLGLFDSQAYTFISEVSKKNIGFLALVSELKLVIAGLSKLNVPFISGHAGAVDTTLDKAQTYLLFTNAVSFVQLMIIGISKSWLVKTGLIALFTLSLLGRRSGVTSKWLILVLALNPGLAMFSMGVESLTKSANIDFGSTYQQTLKAKVEAVRKEKGALMQEHSKNLNQIHNGEKGIEFFKKLKEDVSYDFHKTEDSIKGDFAHIRLLIHKGGQEVTRKLFIFGTMILFAFIIMPFGYFLLIYTLFKTLFQPGSLQEEESKLGITELFTLLKKIGLAIKKEVRLVGSDVKTDTSVVKHDVAKTIETAKQDVSHLSGDIGRGVSDIKNDITYGKEDLQAIKNDIVNDIKEIIGKTKEDKKKVTEAFETEKGKVRSTIDTIANKASGEEEHIESDGEKIKQDAYNLSHKVKDETDHISLKAKDVEQKVHNVVDNVEDDKNRIVSDVSKTEQETKGTVESIEHKATTAVQSVGSKMAKEEESISRRTQMLKEEVKGTIDDPNLL